MKKKSMDSMIGKLQKLKTKKIIYILGMGLHFGQLCINTTLPKQASD